MRSLLLPTFSSAFFRGSQSNTCVTLGLEQGVQPGGAGAFFEGHMQAAVQTVDKGENDLRSSRGWLPSLPYRWNPTRPRRSLRSEEHTSELQSRLHLVCRLLLEKK